MITEKQERSIELAYIHGPKDRGFTPCQIKCICGNCGGRGCPFCHYPGKFIEESLND